jgi:hypothetical protein
VNLRARAPEAATPKALAGRHWALVGVIAPSLLEVDAEPGVTC